MVLGLLLFIVFINDLLEPVISDVYLFANDTKIFRQIKDINDKILLLANAPQWEV